ncbi:MULTISPECIES: hypothetical protein [Brachybacterium]|uniref:hypothetical protein n=1 Tax=Brachybacterium TaxID=43668 RepID=UPI0013520A05|nr:MULTISPECIES: hypothetical protein [Brachybacterium]
MQWRARSDLPIAKLTWAVRATADAAFQPRMGLLTTAGYETMMNLIGSLAT